ncbi:MAG TPA: prepilin-type N-terminal cleavage/methylation domain-containing protein [Humisphaera sp.]
MPRAARPDRRRPAGRGGFTLVELVVVIAIVAVLISIILPVVGRARAMAMEVRCASNQRHLVQAFFAFAADNKGRLPGNYFDVNDPDPAHRSWLRNQGQDLAACPQGGTLWKYVKDDQTYLCPTLQEEKVNSGFGSNGRFDYAAFQVFTGARLKDLSNATAVFTYPDGRVEASLPVPLVCEEEPAGGVNGGNVEGGHSNSDRFTHVHRGGSYFAAVDGSVQWFLEPKDANCWNWQVKAPSGKLASLGPGYSTWGYWDKQ